MRPHDHNPTAPPAYPCQVAEDRPAVRRPQEKIGVLVVDDDHLVRALVQLALERSGFDVWLASNGREAIRLYGTHRDGIAVVLLDVLMPGLDGPETLDALRALNPEILACFMSGDTGVYHPEELRRRGAAQVIAKPFRVDQLADVLRQVTQAVPAGVSPPDVPVGADP